MSPGTARTTSPCSTRCPKSTPARATTDLAAGKTNYQVVVDPRSIFPPDFKPVTIAEITDGTSNTLLVGETLQRRPLDRPRGLTVQPTVPQSGLGSDHSLHSGGFNAGYRRRLGQDS